MVPSTWYQVLTWYQVITWHQVITWYQVITQVITWYQAITWYQVPEWTFSELDFFQNEDSPEFIQKKLFEKRILFFSTTKWTRK